MIRARVRAVVAVVAVIAVAGTVAASGCGVTAADLPLPGGGLDGETYRVHAVFEDALNLPDKAHVKLGGVRIGTVQRIGTENYRAHITMDIRRNVALPADTTAELRQATSLGDVFVALRQPKGGRGGTLEDGDTIGIASTSSATTVEDTLSAMALLVNGGGLGQVADIVDELNTALDGRTGRARHLISELDTTLATLNARSADIDRILRSSKDLTALAKKRRGTLDAALDDLSPAISAVSDQTTEIREVLAKAGSTAEVSERILDATKDDLKSALDDTAALLGGFGELGDDLGPTLRTMIKLGASVKGAAKGEAGAGEATIDAAELLEVLRVGGPPSPTDLRRSGEASITTLIEFLERMGAGSR